MVEVSASNENVAASTLTNDLGEFQILGLPAGIYTITITPEESSELQEVILSNIEINVGEVKVLETVTLE